MKISEGFMPFMGYKTYYRIIGDQNSKKVPLMFLHGGPGSTHNYFEVLDELAEQDDRVLIMYDQIGCGKSFVENRPQLWEAATWAEELKALRQHLKLDRVHLLGQSWGGMLLLDYLCNYKPEGVVSIVLSSTLPSSRMWGEEQHRMIRELDASMQEAIARADETGDYTDERYLAAEEEYMRRHAGPDITEASPECLRRKKIKGTESYITAWGPNEFTPTGTLKDYDVTAQLKDISQPTLIVSGGNDLCTPYIAKYMHDHIQNSRWELFHTSRHCCFVEENERYIGLLRQWLNQAEQSLI